MKVDDWSSTKKIQLKENSTERKFNQEFCGKEPERKLKFNERWNFSIKQKTKKRKEKYSNSKNFVSRTLSQINSRKLY